MDILVPCRTLHWRNCYPYKSCGINFLLTLGAAVICVWFAPTAAGPGIQIIGSVGAVSAGLDLGKEGPLVHIGACIASLLGQGGSEKCRLKWRWLRYFNNDRDLRDLITCGASSGVCAAFRSPVGGVLFSLEEVATWWRSALLWRTFFSTATTVVVLRAVIDYCENGNCGMFGKGGLVMFDVSDVTVTYQFMDIIPAAVIGLLGGVLGSLYNYLLHKVLRFYSLINQYVIKLNTSGCLFGLPFLARCTQCDTSSSETCPTTGHTGNFKQYNCPDGYYNDLATLLFSTNDDAVRNIFSSALLYLPASSFQSY